MCEVDFYDLDKTLVLVIFFIFREDHDYISGCGCFGFILSLPAIATKNSIKAIRNMNENTVSRVGDSTPPRYRSLVSIAMVRAANIPKAAEANSIPFIFSFL